MSFIKANADSIANTVWRECSDDSGKRLNSGGPTDWPAEIQVQISSALLTAYALGGTDAIPPAWVIGTTYAAGARVTRAAVQYASLAGGNVGNDPTGDGGVNWLQLV